MNRKINSLGMKGYTNHEVRQILVKIRLSPVTDTTYVYCPDSFVIPGLTRNLRCNKRYYTAGY